MPACGQGRIAAENQAVHSERRPRRLLAGLLAGLALCVHAADFAPPTSAPAPFRRDRIPLAVGTMTGLSRSLETIARALPGETAAERQAAARALALAMALDPANEEPRKLLDIYQNGGSADEPDASALAGSQARIWQLIAWLETPEAGTNGQSLAFCLKDVMAVADPKHPRSAALREAGEKGSWSGWVPDIDAYESRESAAKPEPESPQPELTTPKPRVVSQLRLPEASVHAVFQYQTGTGDSAKWTLGVAPLQMTATRRGEEGVPPFSIMLGYGGGAEEMMKSSRTIQRLLEKQHGDLPAGIRIRIGGREFERARSSGRFPSVTAAAAVLASAAITGREPEAVIIGQVDETGAFTLPPRFWDQLQALGPGNGRKLVLPATAADWLPSLIAMENPGFFLDHEVLLANDFRQLLELSAKVPEGAAADAAAKFREIRARAEGQDVRSYLANRFVRERLDEIVKAAPFHASAAMLLLQGDITRPRMVTRAALASELRLATEPMEWITNIGYPTPDDPQTAKFSGIHDACKERIDRIERYTDKTDLDLLERARASVSALRRVDRAARGRGESYTVQEDMHKEWVDFSRLYREVAEEINRAAR